MPVCAYGSVGRFEAACLLKRLIDAAARELCMSPEAIRGVNFVPPSAMPYTSATKLLLDSGEFKEVVEPLYGDCEMVSFRKATENQSEKSMVQRMAKRDIIISLPVV